MKYVKKIDKKIQEKIIDHYVGKDLTIKKIRIKYKVSPNTIYEILKINKIFLRGNKLNVNDQKKIVCLYNKGYTIKKIQTKTKIGKSSIIKYLKIHNVKTRVDDGKFKAKYKIDLDVLSKINSKEKAQFLGLIYSDGSLSSHNKLISIRLREDDSEYLENWRTELLKTNKPLYFLNAKCMIGPLNKKIYKRKKGTAILDITSKKIYEDAVLLGLCPNKTKQNLTMPKINKNYIKYFVLGLFEGDGSVCYSKNSSQLTIACQSNMAQNLFDYFRSINIKAYNYKRKFCNIIQISNQKDLKKVYKLFYKNMSKIVMKRKYKKFTDMINSFDKNL